MPSVLHTLCLSALLAVALPAFAQNETIYWEIPLGEVTLTDGTLPASGPTRNILPAIPYVVMSTPHAQGWVAHRPDQGRGWQPWWGFSTDVARLVVQSTAKPPLTGTMFLPNPDRTGLMPVAFEITTEPDDPAAARDDVLEAQATYYDNLHALDIPGAAWFRHRAREIRAELGRDPDTTSIVQQFRRRRGTEMEQTYDLFSGGRAVSENLQLDRELRIDEGASDTVELSTIAGITTPDYDWSAEIEGRSPALDPLASLVPEDQLAVYFPSFDALVRLSDHVRGEGTDFLALARPRSEELHVVQKYERQLCLSLDTFARAVGGRLVRSIVITASDPHFPTGTDVAILFETDNPKALFTAIAAQQAASGAPAETLTTGGHGVHGVATPDMHISSYVADINGTVVVSNSLHQLARIAETAAGNEPAMGALPEYHFFRDRYQRAGENETALIVLTDAAIRKWCSPRWRIAASRRTRAAAALAELKAQHLAELATGIDEARTLTGDNIPDFLGTVTLTPRGIRSSHYGGLDFLVPIAHMQFDTVTQGERAAYDNFRWNYERNWRQFFDPIALRLYVSPESVSGDLTVRPLIATSDYRWFMEVVGESALRPGDGDPHDEAVMHVAIAIDRNAEPVRMVTGMASQMAPNIGAQPLNWFGRWLAVYTDDDPFWQDLNAANREGRSNNFMEHNWHRIPVVLAVAVENPISLTAFLAAARAWIEQTSPGMLLWETREHAGASYVRVSGTQAAHDFTPDGAFREAALYYAALPGALYLTLNETHLRNAIDRSAARRAAAADADATAKPVAQPWLGESMALKASGDAINYFDRILEDPARNRLRSQAWGNIHILNEWKLAMNAEDAVEFHREWWGTELVCPGGGEYVWNDETQSHESTVFGSPAHLMPDMPAGVKLADHAASIELGITFEGDGLRARGEIKREKGAE